MTRPWITRRRALGWLVLGPASLARLADPWRPAAAAEPGRRCQPTGADVRGPFYLRGAPDRAAIAGPDEPGTRLIVRGRVLGPDCQTLPGALLDAWQADASGSYYDARAQYRLRGRLATNQDGRFELFTILPGAYKIDGGYRPAHIHLIVSRPGYRSLTTQLYFKGDPYLAPRDACGSACRSDDPDRILDLRKEEKMGAEFLVGTSDIVLAREGA